MKKPEILAPCGTWDALEAAVKGGADAVYLGGTLFSARAFAGNFDKEELIRAIEYCHFYDVRIYMALNTLLKDDEIVQVRDYMEPFYKAGLDGVIIQDPGVARVLRGNFPDLPLHASTQMSVAGSFGARFLKECGFTRVVPARELSLSEIRSIKEKTDIEIETFVHGAMCYAYSGKCLLSSFIGGRSGNRGRCAQPCRQCWHLTGRASEGKEKGTSGVLANEYVMSLKDMCTLSIVPDLVSAGIDSFKIEGRMKKPEYVAAVTRAYREAVDMIAAGSWDEGIIEELTDDLKDIYSRGGFSQGYYSVRGGREMLAGRRPNHSGLKVGSVQRTAPPSVFVKLEKDVKAQDVFEIREADGRSGVELTGTKDVSAGGVLELKGKDFRRIRPGMSVYRTRNNHLINRINKEILEPEKKIEASAFVEAFEGKPLTITIWKRDVAVCVQGSIVEKAANRPADPQTIREKMQKTGGSGITLDVSCEIGDSAFVQMSELNSLRREAIMRFKAEMAVAGRRE